MIRPNVQHSLANARSYFRDHLCVGDYYSEQNHVGGEWFGRGAEELGLSGKVRALPFLAMCDGNHPRSGARLTQRKNTVRSVAGRLHANRRVFFDFVFSPPKSVSIVGLLNDGRIVDLHARAVRVAMAELERYAETRVRRASSDAARRTGNLVVAMFMHDTSRELDPQIHTHCVTFNATHDRAEDRWKALDVSEMYRAQKFVDACYQHELARGLRGLGYELVETTQNFEIKGVSAALIDLFSKRHRQIDAEAKRVIETGVKVGNEAELRERIARDKRKRKMKDATADGLRPRWRAQMSVAQQAELDAVVASRAPVAESIGLTPDKLVAWGESHVFERNAVARDYHVLAAALLRGRGGDFALSQVKDAMQRRTYVRHEEEGDISLTDQLALEQSLVEFARNRIGRHRPFVPMLSLPESLAGEQRKAVDQILGSTDGVVIFRGGAGTGKSYTVRHVVEALRPYHSVVVVAPQNQQVQGLERDGLKAQTLSRVLEKMELPFGAVVLVDEAGQVSARQLHRLVRLVESNAGRLILCGDTRQHGAVEASDALVLLERKAGLKPVELTAIRRQDPSAARTNEERATIAAYRSAVKLASEQKPAESFDALSRLGWVLEVVRDEQCAALADAFLNARARGEQVLATAQTRDEVARLNEAIRVRLATTGGLGESRVIETIQDAGLTRAARENPATYGDYRTILFLRSYGRFRRGDVATVLAADDKGLRVEFRGKESTLGFRNADRFTVATTMPVHVAVGERLQLRFNGRSLEGHRVANGELVTVLAHQTGGGLLVRDDRGQVKTLGSTQRQFSLGYATTSYGSQGKTVDTVLFSDSKEAAATNQKQWYVTISRGRKKALVFTDDRERLRASILPPGERRLASDVFREDASTTRKLIALSRQSQIFRAVRARVSAASRRVSVAPRIRL